MITRAARITAVAVAAIIAMNSTGAAQAAIPLLPTDPFNALTLDPDGNLYGADCAQGTVYRLDPAGPILVAGNGQPGFSGDGGHATDAGLFCPFAMVFDDRGMFILDHGNNRVRLVDPSGSISTFAGSGPSQLSPGALTGDGGPASEAQFNAPIGMVMDADGDFLIGDRDNDAIRRIDAAGIVTTIAGDGTPGSGGDGGPATAAKLDKPDAIVVDGEGNISFVDASNHRVRKIDTEGDISTIAGDGRPGSSGDGGPATDASLDNPEEGLALDAAGNLFVSETHRIRRIDPSGIITTYAGNGQDGTSGINGPATEAAFGDAAALTMDPNGVLYVSDYQDPCVRAIGADGIIRNVWCLP